MSTVQKRSDGTESRDLVALGARLRAAREEAGLSNRRLAEKIGVHHATIGRIESGEFDQPAPEILQRLAVALEVDDADLFALAGYTIPQRLPGLPAYLRAKYDMPAEAAAQLTEYFGFLSTKYGIETIDELSEMPERARRSALDDERLAA